MTMPGELLHMMESLERENEQLRAQMALMIAALQPCASGEEWKETTALINSSYSPVAFARQVCTELLDEFSNAPTVLFSGEAYVMGSCDLSLGTGAGHALGDKAGSMVQAIVLEQEEGRDDTEDGAERG